MRYGVVSADSANRALTTQATAVPFDRRSPGPGRTP